MGAICWCRSHLASRPGQLRGAVFRGGGEAVDAEGQAGGGIVGSMNAPRVRQRCHLLAGLEDTAFHSGGENEIGGEQYGVKGIGAKLSHQESSGGASAVAVEAKPTSA